MGGWNVIPKGRTRMVGLCKRGSGLLRCEKIYERGDKAETANSQACLFSFSYKSTRPHVEYPDNRNVFVVLYKKE
jgi:hypothetical protein